MRQRCVWLGMTAPKLAYPSIGSSWMLSTSTGVTMSPPKKHNTKRIVAHTLGKIWCTCNAGSQYIRAEHCVATGSHQPFKRPCSRKDQPTRESTSAASQVAAVLKRFPAAQRHARPCALWSTDSLMHLSCPCHLGGVSLTSGPPAKSQTSPMMGGPWRVVWPYL